MCSGIDQALGEPPEIQQSQVDAVGAENFEIDHEGPVANAVGGLCARAQLDFEAQRLALQTRSESVVHGLSSRAGQIRHGTHRPSRSEDSERYSPGGHGSFCTNTLIEGGLIHYGPGRTGRIQNRQAVHRELHE